MCGIFGFVAAQNRHTSEVLAGLKFLEYRGYDSWGIAVAKDGEVESEKATGSISQASTHLPDSTVALGHTRWATHGGVTEANAHPHIDCAGRFAVIHNGIVENYQELGARLRPGHIFLSQTDTEVLAHLLEEEIEREPDLLTALLIVFRQVEGLSAVAVLDAHSGQVAVAKNGSPIALGWADDAVYLASDANALLDHTRRIHFLEDGNAAALTPDGIRVYNVQTGRPLNPEVRNVTWDVRHSGLEGHAHFMIKEIHEQPRVLREIGERKRAEAGALAQAIGEARDVYLIGCGTAYHAAMQGRYLLAEMAGKNSTVAAASELNLILPLLGPDSLVVAFSQSGETIDVLEAVREARARGARIAALVNAEGSALDRTADLSILLGCGPERCVLSTKSYTAKLAVLHMAARILAGEAERGATEVHDASYRLDSLFEREAVHGTIRDTARRITDHQHLFILGRHRNYPLALEAALKIKEVSYLHAEGFAAGELKHGVIALITNGTPCLILAPDEDFRHEALAAASEVQARGAFTVGFSPRPESEFDVTLPVSCSVSAAYEISATAQLLAYELALLRGCDPDKPRNLAKSVTVK
ncbi:MAG: glutamine--fructose-6-phosphate transaminase (isomerizing) [Chloroflexota bacterium]|nr:glutamine--fructose-6-phosphate transaminase (isomerizing) [Chloroflexota bacterium]